ncbi:uncharacterized protein [Agelaius tricolor]|uniref:uncharacterized protein n=1 Tax=Agelaius tricolor TaxID=9191 RepID=UPI0039F2342E
MSLQQKASILQSHCSHSLSLKTAAKGGEGNQQTLVCSAASCPPKDTASQPWDTERPGTAHRPESRAGSPKEAEPVPQLPKEGRTEAAAQARCAPASAGEPQPPCAIPVPPEPAATPSPSPGKTQNTHGRVGLPHTHSPAAPAQCAALGLCRGRGAPSAPPPAQRPPPAAPRYLRSLPPPQPPPPGPRPRAASARAARPKPRPRRSTRSPSRPALRAPPSGGRERRQRREGAGSAPRGSTGSLSSSVPRAAERGLGMFSLEKTERGLISAFKYLSCWRVIGQEGGAPRHDGEQRP